MQQLAPGQNIQQEIMQRRMPIVIAGMMVVSLLLLLRVVSFQFPQDPRVRSEFAAQRDSFSGRVERFESPRGIIYDRDGEPLAVNTRQYRIGISPNFIDDPQQVANQLAVILNLDPLELFNQLNDSDEPYVFLGIVDPEQWQQIQALDLGLALDAERIQRRAYPQGALAAQVVGFVGGEAEDFRGYNGVEGYYQDDLAGRIRDEEVSDIPFGVPEDPASALGSGSDLVLTLDRDIQYLAESELLAAIESSGAAGGTILIMDPRNGDILAVANYPSFDPNAYTEVANEEFYNNPAISGAYEPGSVFKVLTVAAALDSGAITPDWTYYDSGLIEFGGIRVQNWDRQAYGQVPVERVLVDSLNVGAATISMQMGIDLFYPYMERFGIGRLTGVDLQGEAAGNLRIPGDPIWSDSDLLTNSFGQGVSVTPLQMLTAVNAIANDGVMMQPRIVCQIVNSDGIITAQPVVLGRAISPETATIVTNMMVQVVNTGLDGEAQVPGYTVAGKTGTAEIASVLGYEGDAWIMTFVGFLPADNPQVSVLVKLDRPTSARWASQVAAPVFSRLAQRLVVLLEIPNDAVRNGLSAQGTPTTSTLPDCAA